MEEELDLIQSECNPSSDYINNMEEFDSNESSTSQVLLFLSDTCHFCQDFIKNKINDFKDGINSIPNSEYIEVHLQNDTNNLFKQYNIQSVPTCVVVKNNNTTLLNGGNITSDAVENALENM
jgi:thioredoxin-related protein